MKVKTFNRVTLIGNVVKKPVLNETNAGIPVATFHVVTDREWYVNGERRKDSTKHVCVAWDKLANLSHRLLKKGSLVFIEGRLQQNTYIDSNGYEQIAVEIVLDDMILLDRKSSNNERKVSSLQPLTDNLYGEKTDY